MVVIGLDVRILAGDVLERPPPEIMPVGQYIRLGDERELLLAVAAAGVFERPADAPFAALAGVDGGLRGDFIRGPLLEETADARIQVFRVLADDHKIDVFGLLAGQGGLDAGEELDRAEVDVLVEIEPHLQQQPAFENAGRDIRMPDRAEQDRVELGKLLNRSFRKDLAGGQVTLAPIVELRRFDLETLQFGDRFQNLHALGHHFRPGPVAADNRHFENVVAAHSTPSVVKKRS